MSNETQDNPKEKPESFFQVVLSFIGTLLDKPKRLIALFVTILILSIAARFFGYDLIGTIFDKIGVEKIESDEEVDIGIKVLESDNFLAFYRANHDSIEEIWISGALLNSSLTDISSESSFKRKKVKLVVSRLDTISKEVIRRRADSLSHSNLRTDSSTVRRRIADLEGQMGKANFSAKFLDFPFDERMIIFNPQTPKCVIFLKFYPYNNGSGVAGRSLNVKIEGETYNAVQLKEFYLDKFNRYFTE